MPALNFQKQFADRVESGVKKQTIRATRRSPIRVGDTLYLYTGMRTKSCRKLGEAICQSTNDIRIDEGHVKIDGQTLYRESIETLAANDGFETIESFRDFFRQNHGLPFLGQLIIWE